MRRLGAVVAAVAMVGLSLVVRGLLDDGDDEGDGGSGALTLVCDPDLADACEASGATVVEETSGETAARLREDEPLGADAWITSSVWLDVAGLDEPGAELLGRGAITIAVSTVAAEKVEAECPGFVNLVCIVATDAGLKVAIPTVDRALGLAIAGPIVTAITERDEWALQEVEAAEVSDTFAHVEQDDDPFRVLVTRQGTFDAVIVPRPATNQRAEVVEADPRHSIDIVAAGADHDEVDVDGLRGALEEDGWSAADGDVPDSPYFDGALFALLEAIR